MKPRKFATSSASGNSCQSVKSTASDESSIAISSIPSHSCIQHRRKSSAPLSVSWEDVSDHSLSTCDESTDSGEASVLHTVEEGAPSPQRPQHEEDDDEEDDDATYSTLYQDLQDIQSSRQYPRRGSLLELILAEDDAPTICSGCTESTQKMRRPQGGRRRGSSSSNSSSVIQDRIFMDDESSILDLMELRYGASSNSTAVDSDR